jgi:hypothetical protein
VGREIWFLIRIRPRPSRICSDRPRLEGRLVFYLAGGHYTDFESRDLVSTDVAKHALRRWLDANEFPGEGPPGGEWSRSKDECAAEDTEAGGTSWSRSLAGRAVTACLAG